MLFNQRRKSYLVFIFIALGLFFYGLCFFRQEAAVGYCKLNFGGRGLYPQLKMMQSLYVGID